MDSIVRQVMDLSIGIDIIRTWDSRLLWARSSLPVGLNAQPKEGEAVDTPDYGSLLRASPDDLLKHPGIVRAVTEHVATSLFMVDAEGRCLYMNPAAEKMSGYAFHALKGKHLHEALHYLKPDGSSLSKEECRLQTVLREKKRVGDMEDMFIRPDKTFYPIRWAATPVWEDEHIVAVVYEICDITEEKQASRSLAESERRFVEVVNDASWMIWIWNQNAQPVFVSQAWLDYTGLSLDQAMKAGWHEKVHPDDRQNAVEEWRDAFVRKERFAREYRIQGYDGQYRWFYVSSTPRFTPEGKFIGFYATAIDIDDKKQAELDLSESEGKFRRLYDSNMVGVMFWNLKGMITDANDAFLNIVGYTREELQNGQLNWRKMTPPEYSYLDRDAVAQLHVKTASTPYEKQFFHKDGHRIDSLLSGAFLEGSTYDGVAFVQDITERKQTDLALVQSEAKFRRLYDSNLMGVMFWDVDGTITEANDALLNMVGYTREELLAGQVNWRDMTPPEYEHLDEDVMAQLNAYSVSQPCEKQYFHKDGHRIDILWFVALLKEGSSGGVCFVLDITERKRVERALQESEQRFRNIAGTAPVLIWISEPDGYCTYANQAWQEFTGRTFEKILGYHWLRLIHPKDLKKYMGACAEASRAPLAFQKEMRLKHHDGRYRWTLMSAAPRIQEGQFLGYIGTITDIHERKEAELALQKSEEYFRQIADASSVLLWMSDESGEVAYVSQGLADFFGKSKKELMGFEWQVIIHPEDRQAFLGGYLEHFSQKEPFSLEARMIHANGEAGGAYRWVLANGQPRYSYSGEFSGFIGTLVDITDRKEAEHAERRTETYFREIMETAPVNLWMADANGAVTFVNHAIAESFKVEPDEIMGELWWQKVHPYDQAWLISNYREHIQKREAYMVEFRTALYEDGHYLWLLSTGQPRYLASGEFAGYIGTVVDITDRKEAEIALRKSEEYFRYIADTSPVMLWMSKSDGRNEFVSEGLAEYFGLKKEDFKGEQWLNAFHPEDRQVLHETYMEAIRTVHSYNVEIRARTKSGDYRWVLDSGRPRFDAEGKHAGFIGTVTDIHDRKEAMLAIERSEEYFREIADTSPVMLWMAELDASVTFVSQGYADYFGLQKQDFMGDAWLNVLHLEDRDNFEQFYKDHVARRESYTAEYRVLNQAGEARWILDFGQPRFDSQGQCIGFIGTLTDITERKEAMLALERSEEYFRYILNAAPVMLWMSEQDGGLSFVSEGLAKYFGYENDELLSYHWLNALHPEDKDAFYQYYVDHIQRRESYTYEFRANRHGEYRWVLAFGQPRLDQNGEFIGFIGTLTDITDQKEAERVIRESEAQLRSIIDAAPVKVWMSDTQGKYIYISKGMMEFLGIQAEDIEHANEWVTSRLHPEDQNLYFQDRQQYIKKQEPYALEFRVKDSQGQFRWILSTAQPRYTEGQFVGYIGSVIDITEKKEAELVLQESEAYFRMITDLAPVMLWVADENGYLRYISKRMLEFIGYDIMLESMDTEERVRHFFHPDDWEAFWEARERHLATREYFQAEARVKNWEGEYRWVLFSASPRFSTTGDFLGTVGSMVDITDKKEAELIIRESEAQMRTIIDAAPVKLWMADTEGKYVYTSKGLMEFLGINMADVEQMDETLRRIIHPNDIDFLEARQQHIEKHEPYELELRILNAQGQYRWILTTAHPRFAEGEMVGYTGSVVDITEKKEAEIAIRESEAYFRMITDVAPVMLWVEDENGQIRYTSKRLTEFVGPQGVLESLSSRERLEPFHPDDWERFSEVRDRQFAKREPYHVEVRVKNEQGQDRWVLLSASPRFSTADEFLGYVGSMIDITERKQSELSLQESETRFRMMADAAPVMIWMSDAEGLVTYFNKPLLEFLDLTLEEAMQGEYLKRIHSSHLQELMTLSDEIKASHQPTQLETLMFSPPLKEYRWTFSTMVPRFSLDGVFEGYIGSTLDMTDFKQAQEEINKYARRLEQSNRDLEQFATIASHDLQAPLRKIAMFSSYIQETSYASLSGESQDYFNRILKSVDKMQRLLNDLLDLSRVNRKGQPFRLVRLDEVLNDVISDLQFSILDTQGRVEVGNLCTIDADPLQMHQLFQNLVGNALKFHRPGVPPVVRISVEEVTESYCQLLVEDNGIGFVEDQAEKIFEPFVHLYGPEQQYEGTGMGLTICRKIVERHGGKITASSRLGEGTQFRILLPTQHQKIRQDEHYL